MYVEQHNNLLVQQFHDSPIFQSIAEQLGVSFDNVNDMLIYILDNLDVYTATGYLLDVIGLIVGQPREIDGGVYYTFFGFIENNDAAFDVARMWDGGDSKAITHIMNDSEFRNAILARILYNYGDVTLTGISESIRILFNTDLITVKSVGNAKVVINAEIDMSKNQLQLIKSLNLLARAAGVEIEATYSSNPFGFLENNHASFNAGVFVNTVEV